MSDLAEVNRKLVAVFAADVEGYSRLMGADEVGTFRRLTERRVILDKLIEDHRGRIANTAGDSVLAEFGSAVAAVECAVKAQIALAERNASVEPDRRINYRIGVHVGDVMVQAGDLFGDGVNIAARLEGLAEAGGICLSSSAYEHVQGKVAVTFTDLGEHCLKNIGRPIRVYRVQGSEATTDRSAPLSSSAPRMSIVVLPFANIGGNSEQEYFADGVTESLTTDLSRINGALVIARNTAFTFTGKAVDATKLGRELNVRYVLEGSVQRGTSRLRVNVQLIDAESGNHIWAERFDKPIADFLDMQDEIVSRLTTTLDAQLIDAEARRAERSLHPDAMDLVFQGRAWYNKGLAPDHMAHARDFFERALALDPENIEAMAGLAMVDVQLGAALMTDDLSTAFAAAEAGSTKVLSLAPNHAGAHLVLGLVRMFTKRLEQGIAECEQALTLDRNLAAAHASIGFAKYLLGRGAETEAHIREAFRLSPRDTLAHRWMVWVGLAKIQLSNDTEAVLWLRRGLDVNCNYSVAHFLLASALARLGQIDQARAAVKAGLALDPGFTIRRPGSVVWSENPIYLAGRERLIAGMRLAEVPEG